MCFQEDLNMANGHMKNMLNIINHQENAGQNHNEISPQNCQNVYIYG